MRNPEIPDQDVIQAGQALLAAGRLVNAYALRTKTGGGNPQRLLKVWEEHLNGQAPAPLAPVATELPLEMAEELAAVTKALGERIAALATSLNNKAVQAAERRVHQIQRSAHAAQLDGLNKLLQDERSSHQDAVKMQRDELLEQSKNASDARDALNKEVAISKADAAVARQALTQQEASAQKRLEAAETKLGNAGQAASTAREDAARLGGQVQALQAQVTELMRVIATRLAVQDSKEGMAASSVQVETTRLMPDSGSPVLQS